MKKIQQSLNNSQNIKSESGKKTHFTSTIIKDKKGFNFESLKYDKRKTVDGEKVTNFNLNMIGNSSIAEGIKSFGI